MGTILPCRARSFVVFWHRGERIGSLAAATFQPSSPDTFERMVFTNVASPVGVQSASRIKGVSLLDVGIYLICAWPRPLCLRSRCLVARHKTATGGFANNGVGRPHRFGMQSGRM